MLWEEKICAFKCKVFNKKDVNPAPVMYPRMCAYTQMGVYSPGRRVMTCYERVLHAAYIYQIIYRRGFRLVFTVVCHYTAIHLCHPASDLKILQSEFTREISLSMQPKWGLAHQELYEIECHWKSAIIQVWLSGVKITALGLRDWIDALQFRLSFCYLQLLLLYSTRSVHITKSNCCGNCGGAK